MAGKKNGDYEKPESHDVKGDELEDISGGEGSQGNQCTSGNSAGSYCQAGSHAGQTCYGGSYPGDRNCKYGTEPY